MIKVATVFSGIGAIEHALTQMNLPHEIVFACDNGNVNIWEGKSEEEKQQIEQTIHDIHDPKRKKAYIDDLYNGNRKTNFVKQSYLGNYPLVEERFYQDVKYLDGTPYHNQVDLFVGGSPCQSFSNIGKRLGLEDTRGTLFYEFARLVKEIQPKVFIYENVKGLLHHDKGKTWKVMQDVFDELGYTYSFQVLNARDYGIPQNRERIFVVGFKNQTDFIFPAPLPLTTTIRDYLEEQVDQKYYLKETGIISVTNETSLRKRYTQINGDVAICQTANQQFNWKGTFIYEGEGGVENITPTSKVRKLTPRECLSLMGFDKSFKQVVSDHQTYRQSGNSIVVSVLIALMEQILQTDCFSEG